MNIFAYAALGYAGQLVAVEVDIRRGIPGLDIVGLPDSAVRESRERIRIALRRSGFDFPRDRILVNLSPADLKKEGASYDLPIAYGILAASKQVQNVGESILCLGELRLDGSVCAVSGVLPAVATAQSQGIKRFLLPGDNLLEAGTIVSEGLTGITHLGEVTAALFQKVQLTPLSSKEAAQTEETRSPDLADLHGQPIFKRALEIAAAGAHHMLVFGPPGSGKTMGIRTLSGLLPELDIDLSVEITRIWSQAGRLGKIRGLLRQAPFREPHHSSSAEGLVGGAAGIPGEVSLAHGGVLFLDEAPEFGTRVLQTLREPLESGRVNLARAGRKWWYPAKIQLVLAMNACPCGNMGRDEVTCLCTTFDIARHWRRIGTALLDRIDIRVPLSPVDPALLIEDEGEKSSTVQSRVSSVRKVQMERFSNDFWSLNSDIPPGSMKASVQMNASAASVFTQAVHKIGLSSRAAHGVLRVSRTLADMAGREKVDADDILEAVQHRRWGDRDLYWTTY